MQKRNQIPLRTVAARITPDEYRSVHRMASENNVPVSTYLRAIIVDAVADDHELQRNRHAGCQTSGESGEARGAAAA